jgi:site-specific recombinase XerD
MNTSPELARLVQNFFRLHLIERRNVSPNTVGAYRDTLRMFLGFAASRPAQTVGQVSLDDLGRETVLQFLDHLERAQHNSPRTRNARLAAIHSFFRFVAAEDPASLQVAERVLSIPSKKTAARRVNCLDRAEIEHILQSVDRARPLGRRDAALLEFLYNTGARAQEVVDLSLPRLRLAPPAQVLILGKGRKERLCPLWPQTAQLLKDMLRDRRVALQEDVPVFVNALGHRLTRFGLEHIVRLRVAEAARTFPALAAYHVTPHSFRHATALHLLQSGVELNVVRNWLGHASIETTHAYVEIDMQMKRDALKACEPVKASSKQPRWLKPDLLSWLESL